MSAARTESVEMYLETIYLLSRKSGSVRSIDISREMGFSKPSVSRAINSLKAEGLIIVGEGGLIQLTADGELVASRIYERHAILSEGLMAIGVSRETAVKDACRVEHYISDETFQAIKSHFQGKRT